MAVALVVGVVGWYKSINLLLLLGYMMVVLLGLNAYLAWRMAARVSGRRAANHPVFPGEVVVVSTEVTNNSARPTTARVADQAAGNRSAWLLAPIAAGETRHLVARWTFAARGRYPVGPLTVEASYPFGLVSASRPAAPPGEVLVLPPLGRIDRDGLRRWMVRGGAGDGQSRRPTRRLSPGLGDVRGLRPYRSGDGPRDIHWRTSARRGQLLVREYDRAEPMALVVVIDPWLPGPNPDAEAVRRLEWALSLAATLGQLWCDAEEAADITLVVPGDPPVVRSGPAVPGFVRQAFAALAEVVGSPAVPPFPGEVARRSSKAARLVVSPRPASPQGDVFRRAGVPFVAADAANPPGWFTPPGNAPPAPRDQAGVIPAVGH